MSVGAPIDVCDRCGRPSFACRNERHRGPVGEIACDALHRVHDLERFRRPTDAPFLDQDARLVDSAGRRGAAARLSNGTIALVREWRRSLRDERYRSAVKIALLDAIAGEVVSRLARDLADVDLDATIGDLCPECHREKSGEEGARDYPCDGCANASRKEGE